MTFQRQLVRSSNKCYLIFNLLMARSLGFGFNSKYCCPIKTRFRYAYTLRLKLALQTNSLTHYTKGTRSPLRASTACKHSISGSISLPSSGFFSPFPHGTIRYRSISSTSPSKVVLRCSNRISRVPPYLIHPLALHVRGCHPF